MQVPFNAMKCCSVPAKVLLIGEYSVLWGGEGVCSAVKPRFSAERASLSSFHPESPAGRLAIDSHQPVRFFDPFNGAGGMGGSTAEYLCVWTLAGLENDIQKIWKTYREHSCLEVLPSGVDLVTQFMGGTVAFQIKTESRFEASTVSFPKEWFSRFLLFSVTHRTNRKVKTHEHLSFLEQKNLNSDAIVYESQLIIDLWKTALEKKDEFLFKKVTQEFISILKAFGLESSESKKDIEVLSKIPGVIVAKGCGALMNDVFWVFLESDAPVGQIIEEIERLDFKLVLNGFSVESGVETK
ncbi:MAG: hypothetical protein CL678_17880 [Bdellovibrionaceae bacterium]|nr:hypothetical protein [Pseudobdellovibrionaceae bacterium]|tara:strand:+ start:1452 stop:2342 length:891 start_codon:yes stop_codon:yes gene_type:complete